MKNNRKKWFIVIFIVLLFLTASQVYKMAFLNKNNKEAPKPEIKKEIPLLYGEFLSWDEVDKLFPRYAKATVMDFETVVINKTQISVTNPNKYFLLLAKAKLSWPLAPNVKLH